ncbi:solute carrier family 25 member 48 isoform X1 [Pongo abelii]|uniref:solute carrier family 25 member 48 isoform X1 n=1 Tax=Pongo abelii TaxID=9601 RepID=UPI003005144F
MPAPEWFPTPYLLSHQHPLPLSSWTHGQMCPVVYPVSLQALRRQPRVLTPLPSGFHCRCSASSKACPSPSPALPSTTPWCLGSLVTRSGSSASTAAGSQSPVLPARCQTCFWPAWWPAWSLSGWEDPWTSSRSGCRCRHNRFGTGKGKQYGIFVDKASWRCANLGLKSRTVAPGEQPAYQGPVHCITTIVRNEGLAGLYRGASAMLLRDVPGYCLYFIPYVFLSEWITPEACTGPSPCAVWLAGGVAGAISWGTATPMDVVKSRLQADGVYLNKYKGVLDCISQSYQKEGLKVFFRGITVNAVRGFPMSAAMFLGYELSLQAIRGNHAVTSP